MFSIYRQNKNLIFHLVRKELTDQYASSQLGVLWVVAQPLAMLVLYGFVFSVVFRVQPGPQYQGVPFALWLLCGLIPWNFFMEAVVKATRSVSGNPQLVTKSMFDKSALPIAVTLGSLLTHLALLCVFISVSFLFGGQAGWGTLGIAVILLPMTMYIMAWGYILAALNVYLRDVEQFIVIVFQFLFFLTPIVYPIEMAPQWAHVFFELNPSHYFISTYRDAILIGRFPDLTGLIIAIVLCGLFLFVAQKLFRKLAPGFAELL